MFFIGNLVWDEWNAEHVAQHDVKVEEVEETCFSRPFVTRARGRTFRAIGQTAVGRYWTVILAPRGKGSYYPVTAREATEGERRLYRKQKGGDKK